MLLPGTPGGWPRHQGKPPHPSVLPQGYGILNLFLLANLVTTTSAIPVLLGLWRHPIANKLSTPFSTIAGCWISFFSLVVYAAIRKGAPGGWRSCCARLGTRARTGAASPQRRPGQSCRDGPARAGGWGMTMSQAMHYVFFEAYDYPQFIIAVGAPRPSASWAACWRGGLPPAELCRR